MNEKLKYSWMADERPSSLLMLLVTAHFSFPNRDVSDIIPAHGLSSRKIVQCPQQR